MTIEEVLQNCNDGYMPKVEDPKLGIGQVLEIL